MDEGLIVVLFTDVEGSTEVSTRRGDAAARDLLRIHEELVRAQVASHQGRVMGGRGDGFLVTFSSARRALAGAVGIQRALKEHAAWAPYEHVRVRVGLNAGEVAEEHGELYGAAVNAAARICAQAKGGEILLASVVKELAGIVPGISFADRGRIQLRGFAEDTHLYEAISDRRSSCESTSPRSGLVGRTAEIATLHEFVEAALVGRGAVVMLEGEPGVGKTRLADEAMGMAARRGMLALTGHCDEMTGAPPHAPFVEIIEAFTRTMSTERLREALGDDAAEVAKIAPELHRFFPDIPPPVVLPNEHERRYLFNSLRDFFKRASLLRPLLLVLEDLHWADDAALALLCHLAEKVADMPILILGTYRDVEVDVGHRLGHALELLTSRHHCRRIGVRRLADFEVAEMIHGITGQDPPDLIVAPIYAETEGNPFFIEEVVRYLIDDGRLIDAEGRLRPNLTVGDLDVPDRVRLIIGRRLARLNGDTRRLLTAAAVIGRRFGVELLEATAEVAGDRWLDAIEEAERARVILPDDNRMASYRFSHELIRQTLVVDTSLPRRQRLHLRVAEAMQGREARGARPPADEIAHHLVEAGALADPPRTVHYLVLAASYGLAAGAFERALHHVLTALQLLPAGDQRGRALLLEKQAQAERSLGRWDEALVGWRAAVAAYEDLEDSEAVGRLCWELALQLLWSGRMAECHDAVERGLRALGEQDSPWCVQLLTLRGKVFSFSGNHEAGEALIGQAIDLAEELGGGLLGVPLLAKCMHHWCWGELDEARQAGMRGAEISRSAGDLVALSNGLPFLQAALLGLGRVEEAVRIGEELGPLTSRFGHNAASLVAGASRASLQAMAGDFQAFEQVTLDDFALCRETGMPGGSELHIRHGVVAFWRGHWDEALNSFEEAVREELPANAFVGTASAFRLLLRAHQGDRQGVTAVCEEYRRDLPRDNERLGLGAWMNLLVLAEALAVAGVEGEAAAFYLVAKRMIESRVVIRTGDAALVEAVAGMCAAAGKDWPRAEEHYRSALRQARDLPHRIAQPEVRRWFAQMLLRRDAPGDRDQACQLLGQAIGGYRTLGMPRHLEMTEALLAGGE